MKQAHLASASACGIQCRRQNHMHIMPSRSLLIALFQTCAKCDHHANAFLLLCDQTQFEPEEQKHVFFQSSSTLYPSRLSTNCWVCPLSSRMVLSLSDIPNVSAHLLTIRILSKGSLFAISFNRIIIFNACHILEHYWNHHEIILGDHCNKACKRISKYQFDPQICLDFFL